MNGSFERGEYPSVREQEISIMELADMGRKALQDIIKGRSQFVLPEGKAQGSKAYWNELARGLEHAEGWENHPVTREARRIADIFNENESVRRATLNAFVDLVHSHQSGVEKTLDLKRGPMHKAA